MIAPLSVLPTTKNHFQQYSEFKNHPIMDVADVAEEKYTVKISRFNKTMHIGFHLWCLRMKAAFSGKRIWNALTIGNVNAEIMDYALSFDNICSQWYFSTGQRELLYPQKTRTTSFKPRKLVKIDKIVGYSIACWTLSCRGDNKLRTTLQIWKPSSQCEQQ